METALMDLLSAGHNQAASRLAAYFFHVARTHKYAAVLFLINVDRCVGSAKEKKVEEGTDATVVDMEWNRRIWIVVGCRLVLPNW